MVKNLAQTVRSSPGTAKFEMVIPVMEAVGTSVANFEVVIPEAVGPEECVTLHYSLEDVNLFDEMVSASHSLLLLSESGEQEQGKIFSQKPHLQFYTSILLISYLMVYLFLFICMLCYETIQSGQALRVGDLAV